MYNPFTLPSESFTMAVGARPLADAPRILVDGAYGAELAEKQAILAEDRPYYVQSHPASLDAQWETVESLLPELAERYPQHFELAADGPRLRWRNRITGEARELRLGDSRSLPLAPLDWLGLQVQEDLLLLGGASGGGFPLIAGQLCFANNWCLDDKLGLPLLAIHGPVPGYAEQVGRPTDMLMERLKAERPVWRQNWSVVVSPSLNLASRYREILARRKGEVTAENAGERCFLRVERQTLSRLPRTGAVLFTIHSYVTAVGALAADPAWAARFLGLLRSTPDATLAYKGMVPFIGALTAYLEPLAYAK